MLVLTVGTGNRDQIEDSLLAPLSKSIGEGKWERIVLLPSSETADFAVMLKKRFPDSAFDIRALPQPGMENDADACFGHFSGILDQIVEAGHSPKSITIDFTRGTKAMSAALVLAAVGRGIPKLRYVSGTRDKRGMVRPGHETISEIQTTVATARRELHVLRQLYRQGNYAAVLTLGNQLRDSCPDEYSEQLDSLFRRARVRSAWDRLDYGAAVKHSHQLKESDSWNGEKEWLTSLAEQPEKSDFTGYSNWLKRVAWDVLQNGYRRLHERRHEDALLRAYRVLELIGQFRLFEHGLDSSCLDPANEDVKKLNAKLCKSKSNKLQPNSKGCIQVSRFQVAQLLSVMGDGVGRELNRIGDKHKIASKRNHSILVHGFQANAPEECKLRKFYGELESLLARCDPDGTRRRDYWAERVKRESRI